MPLPPLTPPPPYLPPTQACSLQGDIDSMLESAEILIDPDKTPPPPLPPHTHSPQAVQGDIDSMLESTEILIDHFMHRNEKPSPQECEPWLPGTPQVWVGVGG